MCGGEFYRADEKAMGRVRAAGKVESLELSLLDRYQRCIESGEFLAREALAHYGLTPYGRGDWFQGVGRLDDRNIQSHMEKTVSRTMERDAFIRRFGYAVLCKEVVGVLLRVHRTWIEVGAGSGAWTRGLRAARLDVIGSDPANGNYEKRFWTEHHDPSMLSLNAVEAIRAHPDRDVLCVWPSYDETWAGLALREIQPGRLLALVHEGEGGCCAEKGLYRELERGFEELDEIPLACFEGIHDRLTLYRRTK